MRILSDSNPVASAGYFLAVTGIAMFCGNPVLQTLSLAGALSVYLLRNGARGASAHLFSLGIFAVTALINPLVSHNGGTVLFVMNNNSVTLESLLYGIFSAVMITGTLYWFRTFSQVMTSDKLMYIFGALSPKLALIFSMTLRYVPLFGKQYRRTDSAQRGMGLYRDDNIADSFRGGIRIFSVMITWALENGIITADSMSARGYGIGKRSCFSRFRFRGEDVFMLCAAVILSAVTILGTIGAEFEFYPFFKVPVLTVRSAASYVSYGLLIILPIILGAKEELKWKYLRSKI